MPTTGSASPRPRSAISGAPGPRHTQLVHRLDRPFATSIAGANGLARLASGGSTRAGSGDLLYGDLGQLGHRSSPVEYRIEQDAAKLVACRHRSSVVELSIRNPTRPAHTSAGRCVLKDLSDRGAASALTSNGVVGNTVGATDRERVTSTPGDVRIRPSDETLSLVMLECLLVPCAEICSCGP